MEIELTRFFVKVVQNGSFSKAAEILKVPKSTVSKAITRLEAETGTKLLLRTTRSQTLTPAGRVFYETCLGPIQTLEDAQKSLHGQDSILSGTVKLTAPEDIGYFTVAPVVAKLCRQHPKIHFELGFTNNVVDLVKEGYDIAIRLGTLSESRLKARKLGFVTLIPVASPKYLKSFGKIRSPHDLENCDALTINSHPINKTWLLKNKKRETANVSIKSRVSSNQPTSLLQMALSSAGVAFLPHYLCTAAINDGSLVRVLEHWQGLEIPASLVSPVSVASSVRLKLISDELAAAIAEALTIST